MAHKKYCYYAVTNGEEKGIFDEWETCRGLVDHYKGNCYNGFRFYEEAVIFVEKHMYAEEDIAVEISGTRTVVCVKDLRQLNRTA